MRGLKLVVALSLLLATSAFGASALNINGRADLPNDSVAVGDQHTLVLTLANPDGFGLAGYSLQPTAANAGAVRLVTRTLTNALITDPTTTSGNVQNKLLDTLMSTDLGYTGDFDTKIDSSNPIQLMDLVVKLEPGVAYPQTITFKITAYDANFAQEISTASVTLVPEPASMVLLAAGAAFFARRRRQA